MSKVIELTRGLVTVVDDEDFERLSSSKWYARSGGRGGVGVPYAFRWGREGAARTRVFMHREIMKPPAGMFVDHLNRDSLDNRRSNLRLATLLQNNRNYSGRPRSRVSVFKGVTPCGSRWVAKINCSPGHRLYLGAYPTQELAARAYDEAATKWHGEFAATNVSLGLLEPNAAWLAAEALRKDETNG